MSVNPDHVARVLRLVRGAPNDLREEILRRECGDDAALRERVAELLAASPSADPSSGTEETVIGASELAEIPDVSVSESQPSTQPKSGEADDPGTTRLYSGALGPSVVIAGRYSLLERLGEGGMGEVWAARQSAPVKRNVALKLIKSGMDSREILVRFEQERQALALMEHPNIAKVYDAGTTPTGQPFFVMELVKGRPLTKFCDIEKLSPRQRLELFVPICQAIQHAHQKGIVHRDLKPANILVTSIDGKPTPKIIDFGVAKATSGKLTEETMSTSFGAVVGTLEYMAPEQAGTTGEDVDTRADIYSLGVVLYELLTGLRPFDKAQLRKAAISEMIRIIREDDPERPSTRLSGSDALPSIAAVRQTEPARLMAELRGELDWVIMKCLEKSRDRRYETANGLARDIQRYLADEPVDARPPSTAYRLQKFFRRHRTPAIAGGLVLVSMIAGIVGTTWGLLEAREQTRIAVGKTKAADDARKRERKQKELAEQANRQAFQALESFTSDLMGSVLSGKSSLTTSEHAVLENAAKQWEVFAQSRGSSPEARDIRADGAKNLAIIQNRLGLYKDVVTSNRNALAIRDGLASEFPDNLKYREKLAKAHQNLGGGLRNVGQRSEAGVNFKKAADVLTKLVTEFPDEPRYRSALADCTASLGNVARDFGKWAESRQHYTDAIGLLETLVAEFPESRAYRDGLAGGHWSLAYLHKRLEQKAESTGNYQKAIAIYEKIATDAASDQSRSKEEARLEALRYRGFVASLLREFGVMLGDFQDDEAAAQKLAQAIVIHTEIAEEFPSARGHQASLAKAHRDYGQVLRYLKKHVESKEHYDVAVKIFTTLTAEAPTVLPHQFDLGITYRMLGDLETADEKPDDALQTYNKSIEILTAVYVQERDYASVKGALCNAHRFRAETLDQLDRHREALPDWDKALEFCSGPRHNANIYRTQRADSRLRAGDVAEALQELAAIEDADIRNPFHWFNKARLYAIATTKLPDRTTELQDKSLTALRKARALGYKDATRLREEKDLSSLKSREEFVKLLQDMNSDAPD